MKTLWKAKKWFRRVGDEQTSYDLTHLSDKEYNKLHDRIRIICIEALNTNMNHSICQVLDQCIAKGSLSYGDTIEINFPVKVTAGGFLIVLEDNK